MPLYRLSWFTHLRSQFWVVTALIHKYYFRPYQSMAKFSLPYAFTHLMHFCLFFCGLTKGMKNTSFIMLEPWVTFTQAICTMFNHLYDYFFYNVTLAAMMEDIIYIVYVLSLGKGIQSQYIQNPENTSIQTSTESDQWGHTLILWHAMHL